MYVVGVVGEVFVDEVVVWKDEVGRVEVIIVVVFFLCDCDLCYSVAGEMGYDWVE